ncbi:MAG: phage holin [Eubacteriaceae bacterium]
MKITKGTIIRTIMLAIVLINYVLQRLGIDVIRISENQIADALETLISIAVIVVAWWENNSFSEKAKKADAFLKLLQYGDQVAEDKDINTEQDAESEVGQ